MLTDKFFHSLEKNLFFSAGNRDKESVEHFDMPPLSEHVFDDMFEIYQVRVMRSEKIALIEQFLEILEIF
jgi:hypothetical protein